MNYLIIILNILPVYKNLFRFNYILLVNLVFLFNYIGLIILNENNILLSNINFIIFWFFHNLFFILYKKIKKPKIKRFNTVVDYRFLKLIFLLIVFFSVYFFSSFGTFFQSDNVLVYRTETLGYAKGIFSRIFLHLSPIISCFFVYK